MIADVKHAGQFTGIGSPTSEVWLMDCMEGMMQYPDNHFDLAVIDPPYKNEFNIPASDKAAKVKKHYNLGSLNTSSPNKQYFIELKRVSKNQIIWGVNYYKYYLGAGRIVWDKDNTGVYSDCELAYHSFSDVTRKYKYRWNGMLQGNMKDKEHRIHPTQKPVALYDWIFHNYAKQGDLILDTHLGSGSSRIAADKGGLSFVGFEIDKEYFDAANKRFDRYKQQLRMF